MPDITKITVSNLYGKPVEVTADGIGDLIATLQCLPESLEEGGEDLANTIDVLKRRLGDLGVVFDRRETEEYRKQISGDDETPSPSA